jgi:hypothetical protein
MGLSCKTNARKHNDFTSKPNYTKVWNCQLFAKPVPEKGYCIPNLPPALLITLSNPATGVKYF